MVTYPSVYYSVLTGELADIAYYPLDGDTFEQASEQKHSSRFFPDTLQQFGTVADKNEPNVKWALFCAESAVLTKKPEPLATPIGQVHFEVFARKLTPSFPRHRGTPIYCEHTPPAWLFAYAPFLGDEHTPFDPSGYVYLDGRDAYPFDLASAFEQFAKFEPKLILGYKTAIRLRAEQAGQSPEPANYPPFVIDDGAFDIAKIAKNTKPYDDHECKLTTHVQGRDTSDDGDDGEQKGTLAIAHKTPQQAGGAGEKTYKIPALQWTADGLSHHSTNALTTYIIATSHTAKGKFDLYAHNIGRLTDDKGLDLAGAMVLANSHYKDWLSDYLELINL